MPEHALKSCSGFLCHKISARHSVGVFVCAGKRLGDRALIRTGSDTPQSLGSIRQIDRQES
ncbi:hypothetical protein DAQ1742_02628 [Dickeya aquatica]|uniref:Uncharacterized protein n=1 Tax=Dickeya aquatica TaxID=1401087 RepID=A0A375AC23_9GAMM|nr:hypothetical protein DAQ1742_02628 [Dickeya aquatica]